MDILFLAHRIPYPPDKGDKIRSYHLLRHLADRHRVHLGCFIDDPADAAHVETLRSLCADVCVRPLDPLRARLRALPALLRGEALTIPYYRDARLARWVRTVMGRIRPVAVVVYSSAMAQYVLGESLDGARLLVDFVDVDSDKWAQYARESAFPFDWLYAREARTLLAFDRRVAQRARAALFVSPREAALFARLAPESAGRIDWWPNGVDTGYFAPRCAGANPYAAADIPLVFTGAMDYRPNADAAIGFVREVFPALRARIPALRFAVVGARPGPAVRELAGIEGVTVTGTVADVRPWIGHAHAVVAPLRIARGVQNKVLEGMAMAKPVVASPQALEGIEAEPGHELLRAEDVAEWIDRLTSLLAPTPEAAASRAAFGAAARAAVESRYTWEAGFARFARHLPGGAP